MAAVGADLAPPYRSHRRVGTPRPPDASGRGTRRFSANTAKLTMPEFRYYCRGRNNKIIHGRDLIAPDLEAAVRAAYEACQGHPWVTTSRIEIWQGDKRLYTSSPDDKSEVAALGGEKYRRR